MYIILLCKENNWKSSDTHEQHWSVQWLLNTEQRHCTLTAFLANASTIFNCYQQFIQSDKN